MIRRGFVDLDRGQIHYRCGGAEDAPQLLMLHASPGSSRQLEPLIAEMAESFRIFAPDTMGNGDSMPPPGDQPDIADYANAVIGAVDRLGLDRFRLYGTHTGARIACEIALSHPKRVDRLILDGFGVYAPDDADEILKSYAPEMVPDQQGAFAFQAWQFCRDQFLWFPWYRKEAERRVPHDLPDAEFLYARYVEILKALKTYHQSYRAAFRYSMAEHVPKITQPTLITFAENDLVRPAFDEARALLPRAEAEVLPGTRTPEAAQATAERFRRFLLA